MSERRESRDNYIKRRLRELWKEQDLLEKSKLKTLEDRIQELETEISCLKHDNAELTKCYYQVLEEKANARRS